MRLVYIFLIVFILMITPVFAREYCCVGPMGCEGFNSYNEVVQYCDFKGPSYASYSCSHRFLKDYCQSKCKIGQNEYIVYDVKDCETLGGKYYFQKDINVHDDKIVRGQVVSGNSPVSGVTVKIDDYMAVTGLDGKFKLYTSLSGSHEIVFKDEEGRYATKSQEVMLRYDQVIVGKVNVASSRSASIHVDKGNSRPSIENYKYLPMPLYNLMFN